MKPSDKSAFAVWLTGLPASGKSTVADALQAGLIDRGVEPARLESDALREILTPRPRYDEEERDLFYRQMTYIGELLIAHGVPVIFDATANRRRYRDEARADIRRFLEVYLDCPLEVCVERDPKGIYRQGRKGWASAVPGMQAAYEPPINPDVVIHSDREEPGAAAQRIIEELERKGYLPEASAGAALSD